MRFFLNNVGDPAYYWSRAFDIIGMATKNKNTTIKLSNLLYRKVVIFSMYKEVVTGLIKFRLNHVFLESIH